MRDLKLAQIVGLLPRIFNSLPSILKMCDTCITVNERKQPLTPTKASHYIYSTGHIRLTLTQGLTYSPPLIDNNALHCSLRHHL